MYNDKNNLWMNFFFLDYLLLAIYFCCCRDNNRLDRKLFK